MADVAKDVVVGNSGGELVGDHRAGGDVVDDRDLGLLDRSARAASDTPVLMKPTSATTCSLLISSCVICTPRSFLASSSRSISWIGRPSTPPAALIFRNRQLHAVAHADSHRGGAAGEGTGYADLDGLGRAGGSAQCGQPAKDGERDGGGGSPARKLHVFSLATQLPEPAATWTRSALPALAKIRTVDHVCFAAVAQAPRLASRGLVARRGARSTPTVQIMVRCKDGASNRCAAASVAAQCRV